MSEMIVYKCDEPDCGAEWHDSYGRPTECPECNGRFFYSLDGDWDSPLMAERHRQDMEKVRQIEERK